MEAGADSAGYYSALQSGFAGAGLDVLNPQGGYWLTAILGLLFLTIFLLIIIIYYHRLHRKVALVGKALDFIEKHDPVWRKEHLQKTVKSTFLEVLGAWDKGNREALRKYLTPELYSQWTGLLDRMREKGQREVIGGIEIRGIMLIDIKDYTDDTLDRFTARIHYRAAKYTVNENGEWVEPEWAENLDPNPGKEQKEFIEFWTFQRSGKDWKLTAVEQEWKEGNYMDSEPVLADEKYMKEVRE